HNNLTVADWFAPKLFERKASPSTTTSTSTGLALPDLLPTIRWVFPTAQLNFTSRFDTEMMQWFEMRSVKNPSEENEFQIPGLVRSMQYILSIIEYEAAILKRGGGGREKIFLAGMSSGFATAIESYFADGKGGFAGLIGLCSWLPFVEQVEGYLDSIPIVNDRRGMDGVPVMVARKLSQIYRFGESGFGLGGEAYTPTSIFLAHCADDKNAPKENGERMKNALTGIVDRCGGRVEWHLYEHGGHELNEPQGVDDLVKFIRANMAKGG
ncbi:putative carboxylesterase, partial [Rhypophila sp. PSN 637]